MSNYNHQKKHHGIPGLGLDLFEIVRLMKKVNKHKKRNISS